MNKCGIVTMKNPYKIYNFKHHVDSSKLHKKSLEREQFHEGQEAKKRGEVRKKMNLYLLFCVKGPKTPVDVQERSKAYVSSQDAVLGGTSVDKYLSKQVGEDGNNFPNTPAVKTLPSLYDVKF